MKSPQLNVFNYSIRNASNDSLDIYIDGDIVDADTQEMYKYWLENDTSTSYKSFRDQVNSSDAKIFNVYINSGGGLVTDAMAIHDLLIEMQSKGKTVNTIGRGIIASAATYILMAGKSSSISKNSWFMIHNVSGVVWGEVNVIEGYARTMRKFNDAARDFYVEATGMSATVIGNMMNAETWLTGSEATEKGFVKQLTSEANFTNSISKENWQFKNTSVLNAYNSFTISNSSNMDTSKIAELIEDGFKNLKTALGITNKKDEDALQNAFNNLSEGITNGLKDVPDNNSIQNMIAEAFTNAAEEGGAIANALKDVATKEEVTNAVNDGLKNSATKEDIKNMATKDDIKNIITKDDLQASMNTLTNSIIDKMGGQSNAEKKEATNNSSKSIKNKRFAGVNWEN